MSKGRISGYYTKVKPYLELIEELRLEGMGVREICERLTVPTTSWYEYVEKFPEFAEVMERANESYSTANNAENKLVKKINDLAINKDPISNAIRNATFSLTVLVQHDELESDEDEEWVLIIKKYDTLLNRE